MMGIDGKELLEFIYEVNYTIKTITGESVNKISLDEYILDPV
jgi:hypothetical protein